MPVAIVSVPVKDQIAARDWYRDKLNLSVMRDEAMGPEMRWIQLQPKTGGATIALTTWFENMQPGQLQGVMLHVPDVDAEHARLTSVGVAATPVDEQPWGRFTMLNDPDGNGWIVAQLTHPEEIAVKSAP
jgi:predicted enzyme related to lactoylglutathione lyase